MDKWLTYRNEHARERLVEATMLAKKLGLKESLSRSFETMRNLSRNMGGVCELMTDFAPMSMGWAIYRDGRCIYNGGLIYHGPHDGGGDGSYPTLAVCLTPTSGWSIHT